MRRAATLRAEDLLAARIERRLAYRGEDVLLYNLGIGIGRDPGCAAELPFLLDAAGPLPLPGFAAVLDYGVQHPLLATLPLDWPRVVHAGQRLTVHAHLPPAAEVVATCRVDAVADRGERGTAITVTTEVRLADGTPLHTSEAVVLARGQRCTGAPPASARPPAPPPDRAPDLTVRIDVRPEQALLFRLNGDTNPLHTDPAFARGAGFPSPILHGLCTWGMACRAIVAAACDHDAGRLETFAARMAAPVYPGDTLLIDLWRGGATIAFAARVEARGATVLDRGLATIAPAA